jgi:hypothetical protein
MKITKQHELLQQALVAIGLSLKFINNAEILKICDDAIIEITKELKNLNIE